MVNYDEAAAHWQAREKDAVRMPEEELRDAMEKYVASHRVCALACASSDGTLVRNTPHRVRVVRRRVLDVLGRRAQVPRTRH